MKKADMIIDMQFGSTGKGLIAGYLAEVHGYDTVVNANMPNAGHTYINSYGRKWVHKVLPNGIVSPRLKTVMLGPGSVFSLERLREEVKLSKDLLENVHLLIHENAMVLHESHKMMEETALRKISSTMQGSAAAVCEKIMRQSRANMAAIALMETEFADCVVNSADWQGALYSSNNILIEGAQGYSLGINAGFYPFCTSRDCTPARFLADCGVPVGMLRRVIGTARVHPIRVGSVPGGYSGDCYKDQVETSWDELGVPAETTTVTGRERRVFTFSRQQIKQAMMECQPDDIFLNFINYDIEYAGDVVDSINEVSDSLNMGTNKVTYFGYGPSKSDVLLDYVPF